MWTLSRSNVNSKELNDIGVSVNNRDQPYARSTALRIEHSVYDTDLGIIDPLFIEIFS